MSDFLTRCGNCGEILNESFGDGDRVPCERCGSMSRSVTVSVTQEIQFREQVNVKATIPSFPGKGHLRIEQLVGDDLHKKSGKWYKKVRIIDRENNLYLETVTDPDTGEVVHHCEKPLIDHYGHGAAKW